MSDGTPGPDIERAGARPQEAAGQASGSAVEPPAGSRPKDDKAGLRLSIDYAPLVVWLVAFRFFGIVPATAVLMVATLLSVLAARFLLGKVSPTLWVTAGLVTLFGGLTVYLNDPHFIKIKPTAVNLLFAGVLGFGLLTGRPLLKMLIGDALSLSDRGWRIFTVRWIILFVGMAALNEIVWRATDTPQAEYLWAYFKFPGIPVLTMLFMAAHIPFLRKHMLQGGQETID